MHQGLGQHDPSMPQNGTPDYLPKGNVLNDEGTFSAHPTVPSHSFLQVPQDDMIIGASLTGQGITSLDLPADISSGFSSFEEVGEWLNLDADESDQGIAPTNNGELSNSNNQPHGGNL